MNFSFKKLEAISFRLIKETCGHHTFLLHSSASPANNIRLQKDRNTKRNIKDVWQCIWWKKGQFTFKKKKRKQTNSFEVKVKATSLKGNQKLLSIKTWKENVSPNYICKYWLSVEISLFADLSRGIFTVIF